MNEENQSSQTKVNLSVNDWVRYYDRQGELKIGCVCYIHSPSEGQVMLSLDNGHIPINAVVEVRNAPAQKDKSDTGSESITTFPSQE